MLEFIAIACPYCGESFETSVDTSAGSTTYVEDCTVCCKPINVRLSIDDDGTLLDVQTKTDSE
ncbi:MAG: CPXCG motif-containing cysteine-rich protein [Rhodanobacteraceae bacterium]|nr:CPXCG motif-containing cysteine-rich protein [Pseudomonadota bacterium]